MYCVQPTIEQVLERVQALSVAGHEMLLVYVGEECGIEMDTIVEALQPLNISFAGGTFPGVIAGEAFSKNAILLQKYRSLAPPQVVEKISEKEYTLPDFSLSIAKSQHPPVALTLIDGLTSHIADFLSTLYDYLGNSVHFIGGGAGSLSLQPAPCLFTNEGVFQDAAILCFLDYSIGLGVKHGWKELAGPIVATRTDQNIIYELNWRPALEVYREVVEVDAQATLGEENFFSIAKGYPFGMYREQGENIVRDPISTQVDQSLICVGDIPEHTVLHILKGEQQLLLDSAKQAAQQSVHDRSQAPEQVLLIDCISRTLFLEDEFQKELGAINNTFKALSAEVNLGGVLTLGEISSFGNESLQFYNKTIVVGSFYPQLSND
ncbi:MAG: FIST C-terminal domain-containing protein [Bacteroidota bacterium]